MQLIITFAEFHDRQTDTVKDLYAFKVKYVPYT